MIERAEWAAFFIAGLAVLALLGAWVSSVVDRHRPRHRRRLH